MKDLGIITENSSMEVDILTGCQAMDLELRGDPRSKMSRIPSRVRAPPLLVTKLTHEQKYNREKTFRSASTALGKAMELMFRDLVTVSEHEIQLVLDGVNQVINSIKNRINQNRYNLKFGEPFCSGPAVLGLHNKFDYHNMDIYLPVKLKDFRQKPAIQGYTCIYLSRNSSYDRFQSIRSEKNVNFVSPVKLSRVVHEIISHVCQSVGCGEVMPFESNLSGMGEGSFQLVALLRNDIRVRFIPCLLPRVLKKDDDGTIIVAKPYHFDQDPDSDMLWRFDNPTRMKSMLEAMNKADRGTRIKALRLAIICQQIDHVLCVCPKEFIVVTLLNMFDEDVDGLPSWQTVDLDNCFLNILTYWQQHMANEILPHPFIKFTNMLCKMPKKTIHLISSRLVRLLHNRRELLRLLKNRLT